MSNNKITQKILLIAVLLISFFGMNLQEGKGQSEINWANLTLPPCYDGVTTPEQRGPWKGPFTFRVCPTDAGGCCYTIVYYDRMYKQGEGWNNCPRKFWQYDVSVTGIFYEDEGCKTYNKDSIISKFHQSLFVLKNGNQSFKDSVTSCCTENGAGNSDHYIWVSSNCYSNENTKCVPNTIRCCREIKRANYNRTVFNGDTSCVFVGWTFYTTPEPVTPDCPENCTPKCNDVLMEHIAVTACDMPCNWEPWSENKTTSYVVDPACPACVVTITYKDRSTTGCNPNYKDYKIESISYNSLLCLSPGCATMLNINNSVMAMSMNYLLTKFTDNADLDPNECVDNIRIMKSTCFKFEVDGGGNAWLVPCNLDYCCWVNLRICRDNEDNITKTVTHSSGSTYNECINPASHPCSSYCFDEWIHAPMNINIENIDKNNNENKINNEK